MALLLSVPSALRAQEADSTEEHEVLFVQAVEALRLSQFEVASRQFVESLRLRPQAKTACNLALTYDRWGGHEVEARDAYFRCAELDQGGRFRDHALARAAALREVIAARPPDERRTPDPDPDTGDPDVVHQDPLGQDALDQNDRDEFNQRDGQGDRRPVDPPTSRPARGLLWAGVAFAVVGVVTVGSGVAPTRSAGRDSDMILDKYPLRAISATDTVYLQLNEEFERKQRVAIGLYVAGGTLTLVGAAFIIADIVGNRRQTPPSTRVGVAPTEGGMMAVGRFEF